MNWAHVHLMLNHVPLYGALAGTIVLGLSVATKRQAVARAGFVVIVMTGIVAGVVYLTGEPAEELVENLPGVSEAAIERHEEVALVSTLALSAFALVALYGSVVPRGASHPARIAPFAPTARGHGVHRVPGRPDSALGDSACHR